MDANILRELGFQGQDIGKILKAAKTWTPEQTQNFLDTKELPKSTHQVKMLPDSVWEWLCNAEFFQNMFSIAELKIASNSEKRRWLEQKAVLLNGRKPDPDDLVPTKITELVFFPNSKNKKITMV